MTGIPSWPLDRTISCSARTEPQVVSRIINFAVLHAQGSEGDTGNGVGKFKACGVIPGACNSSRGHFDRFVFAVGSPPVGNAPVRTGEHDIGIALGCGQRALGFRQFLLQLSHFGLELGGFGFQISFGSRQVGVQLLFFGFQATFQTETLVQKKCMSDFRKCSNITEKIKSYI